MYPTQPPPSGSGDKAQQSFKIGPRRRGLDPVWKGHVLGSSCDLPRSLGGTVHLYTAHASGERTQIADVLPLKQDVDIDQCDLLSAASRVCIRRQERESPIGVIRVMFRRGGYSQV